MRNALAIVSLAVTLAGCCSRSELVPNEGALRRAVLVKRCADSKWLDKKRFTELMTATEDDNLRALYLLERIDALGRLGRYRESIPLELRLNTLGDAAFLAIVSRAKSSDKDIRRFAVAHLPHVADTETCSVLLVLALDDDYHFVRLGATIGFEKLGRRARPAVPAMVIRLFDESWKPKRYLARAIGKVVGVDFPTGRGDIPGPQTVAAAKKWARTHYGDILGDLLGEHSAPSRPK